MGGCRCTFRNCTNSTFTHPGMHFFHFPFRNTERCEKWALHSNNLSFLQLPINKLRNKVICGDHFKQPCFMNFRRDRLTKWAIPTLLKLTSGEIIDFEYDEANKTIYNVQADKNCSYENTLTKGTNIKSLENSTIKSITYQPSNENKDDDEHELNIAHLYTTDNTGISSSEFIIANEPIEYTPIQASLPSLSHSLIEKPVPKLLNGFTITAAPSITLTELKRINIKSHGMKRKQIQKILPEIPEVEKKKKIETAHLDTQANVENLETIELLDAEDEEVEEFNCEPVDAIIIERDNQIKLLEEVNDEQAKEIEKLKALLKSKTIRIVELESEEQKHQNQLETLQKKLIQKIISPPPNVVSPQPPPTAKIKPEKLTMTKPILFNGIRRYLNPTMVSLLRMELFGDPERAYKPDEREFAMELMNLSETSDQGNGTSVYDYMRSEWRFRLPPKTDVQQWIKEKEDNDETIDWDDC